MPNFKNEKIGTKKERVIMTNSLMTKVEEMSNLDQLVVEMKKLAAQLEQGITTWENTCGYNNEELLPFLNLPTEGAYV
jgi:hypothetical protein